MKSNQKYIAVPVLETAPTDQDWVLASDELVKYGVIVHLKESGQFRGAVISDNGILSVPFIGGGRSPECATLCKLMRALYPYNFLTIDSKRILTEPPETDYILLKDVPDNAVIMQSEKGNLYCVSRIHATKLDPDFEYFYLKPID